MVSPRVFSSSSTSSIALATILAVLLALSTFVTQAESKSLSTAPQSKVAEEGFENVNDDEGLQGNEVAPQFALSPYPYGLNLLGSPQAARDAAFARQMLARQLLRNYELSELLRKRSGAAGQQSGFYKQCAFNAVSCFGRKRK